MPILCGNKWQHMRRCCEESAPAVLQKRCWAESFTSWSASFWGQSWKLALMRCSLLYALPSSMLLVSTSEVCHFSIVMSVFLWGWSKLSHRLPHRALLTKLPSCTLCPPTSPEAELHWYNSVGFRSHLLSPLWPLKPSVTSGPYSGLPPLLTGKTSFPTGW